ncbi:MAG: hypothetical protein LBG84_10750 [Treponema sp.]|jgi:hypothetical protein|nr:hypothetical protein [Treponema sp.]
MENTRIFSLILLKEINLLEKIPPLQGQVRDAVLRREWTAYEALTESIGELGAALGALEEERAAVFAALAGETETSRSFYAWAARLPPEERRPLADRYRVLRALALQVKLTGEALAAYLQGTRTAIAGVLDRAYPDRRGKLYSRRGTEREADMRSVMINTTF